MEIRFAQEEDISQIIDLCKKHAEYENANYNIVNKTGLLSKFLFGQYPSLRCLVVVEEDTILGYSTFMKQFSTWDAGFYIYLDCLYLTEHIRGKGLGRRIMKKIKEYAKVENCNVLQWQTPDSNKDAIVFYKMLGGLSKSKERFYLEV